MHYLFAKKNKENNKCGNDIKHVKTMAHVKLIKHKIKTRSPLTTWVMSKNKKTNILKKRSSVVAKSIIHILNMSHMPEKKFSEWTKSVDKSISTRFGTPDDIFKTNIKTYNNLVGRDFLSMANAHNKKNSSFKTSMDIFDKNYDKWEQLMKDYLFEKLGVFFEDLCEICKIYKSHSQFEDLNKVVRRYYDGGFTWFAVGQLIIDTYTRKSSESFFDEVINDKVQRFIIWMGQIDNYVKFSTSTRINKLSKLVLSLYQFDYVKDFCSGTLSTTIVCGIIDAINWEKKLVTYFDEEIFSELCENNNFILKCREYYNEKNGLVSAENYFIKEYNQWIDDLNFLMMTFVDMPELKISDVCWKDFRSDYFNKTSKLTILKEIKNHYDECIGFVINGDDADN